MYKEPSIIPCILSAGLLVNAGFRFEPLENESGTLEWALSWWI